MDVTEPREAGLEPTESRNDTVEEGHGQSGKRSSWNFTAVTAALVIGLVGQMTFLPCLCAIGNAKLVFALLFDGLIVV